MADGLVPVGHHRPPLRVQVWTDREEEAVYYPGEEVTVHVTTNDGAYVLVYDIDTEGRVRRLFPAPGDPGYVHAHEVVSLPGPHAAFDYLVTGPPGIETIEAVASRLPLLPWEGPEPWEEEDGEWQGDEDGHWEEEQYEEEYEEGEESGEDGEWDEGIWRSRTEARVSGDPYLAIDRMNHRVLPESCAEDDYATDFVTFCVGRHVSYPRYACNDCHGSYPAFDPYVDACSVFRVEVNVAWFPPPTGVVVVGPVRPRYVYVRREHVPVRYRHLKGKWSGWDRKQIDRELKPMVKAVRRPSHKADSKWGQAPPRKREAKVDYRSQAGRESGRDPGRDPKLGRSPRVYPEGKVRSEAEVRRGGKVRPETEVRREGKVRPEASRSRGPAERTEARTQAPRARGRERSPKPEQVEHEAKREPVAGAKQDRIERPQKSSQAEKAGHERPAKKDRGAGSGDGAKKGGGKGRG
jgi:hypothetical protein